MLEILSHFSASEARSSCSFRKSTWRVHAAALPKPKTRAAGEMVQPLEHEGGNRHVKNCTGQKTFVANTSQHGNGLSIHHAFHAQ
jgi:hypothetical protein